MKRIIFVQKYWYLFVKSSVLFFFILNIFFVAVVIVLIGFRIFISQKYNVFVAYIKKKSWENIDIEGVSQTIFFSVGYFNA